MKTFFEDIDQLRVNCSISDYLIEFTLAHPAEDKALFDVQQNLMLPMFRSIRTESEKHHTKGKLKKLQSIYKNIEQESAENILLEEYVLNKTGIALGMKERYYKRLTKIIERGKLRNDQEYYMIMDQVNLLCQMQKRDEDVIEKLNKLFAEFEKKGQS